MNDIIKSTFFDLLDEFQVTPSHRLKTIQLITGALMMTVNQAPCGSDGI